MGGNALPAFMDEVPEYTVKDGRMYICMGDFCLCMPLHVFLDGCELGKAAIVDWQRRQCRVDGNIAFLNPRT
jgi:hypothetical protein